MQAQLNSEPKQAETKPDKKPTKISNVVRLVSRKKGATMIELQKATGWQAHSIRGAISAILNKKMGLKVASDRSPRRGLYYFLKPAGQSGHTA